MEFIETSVFTRQITQLLTDAEYEQLQRVLLLWPLAGDLIKHSGGLRKLRYKAKGKGKRGGIRVVYYYLTEDEKIFMLYAYPKGRKDDLNAKELKILRAIVKEELS
ncbi:MAG: type II toxin-antitoxin system RelE/ParE family toxin [Planctomycetes bacterium]|nr:type II toxin-antitoxin system RelE/ParE family toxin [Planctomycetota bacterium]